MGERTGDGPAEGVRASEPVPSGVPWNDLAAFLAVARAGGLAGAARAHGLSAPTLGRRMRALERALGRELFVRHTHGYELTADGIHLRDDLAGVEAGIARATAPPPGAALPLVKIAAGTWTMLALVRHTAAIAGDPPDLRLRFLSGEDVLSIPRREAAIGFRRQRPTESGVALRRLGRVEFAPYAAPEAPERWIAVTADTPSARWVAARAGGDALETDTPRLALDMALAGLGRALLPTFVGDDRPDLARVGPTVDDLAHEPWLVTHADDRELPELRRALDRIATVLG